jgi:hypothetical protein
MTSEPSTLRTGTCLAGGQSIFFVKSLKRGIFLKLVF